MEQLTQAEIDELCEWCDKAKEIPQAEETAHAMSRAINKIDAVQDENKRLVAELAKEKEHNAFLSAACEANGATAEIAVKRYGEFVDRMKGEMAELAAYRQAEAEGRMVRVVRCEECKRWTGEPNTTLGVCDMHEIISDKKGYCAFAEPMERVCAALDK